MVSVSKQIYLDHNATTVMEQGAQSALLLSLSSFGNPASIHSAGRAAKSLVDKARDQLAALLQVNDPDELVFTGSATEATNTALKGFFFYHMKEAHKPRIICSKVEHEATLNTVEFLKELGAQVELLSVGQNGQIDLGELEQLLKNRQSGQATMVSLMAANNETGVIFPWEEAARLARQYEALFHLDAVQAPGKLLGFSLAGAPVDLASFSAHKIGGMKGIGALYIQRGCSLKSLIHGGAQERKRRAGTLNVPGIVSFGAAAASLAEADFQRVRQMRDHLENQVLERVKGAQILGVNSPRILNTSSLLFDDVRGEALLMGLDLKGFAVSSGSACNSGSILPSHVLLAMGLDKRAAASAIRVSLGPSNTEAEIAAFLEALEEVVARVRSRK